MLDCSGHRSTWESHSPCPWKLITMQIAQHEHGNTLCVAHQNLTYVATISKTVLKGAGLHFDTQDPWEHMGQQVLQGAHWYCCSAPTTPNCLGDGRLQHPWRNETVLEHLAHKLQLPLAGNFWILPMASLSHRETLSRNFINPAQGVQAMHTLFWICIYLEVPRLWTMPVRIKLPFFSS